MNWKRVGKKLLFPPLWVMMVFLILSAAALIFVFVKGLEKVWFSYVVYVLAFYSLLVVCVFLGLVLPKRYKEIKKRIYDNPLGYRYMTDAVFRTHVS